MVGRPARLPDRTTAVNSGRRRRRACAGSTSGGELLAALAPTAGDDRPARAGAHPQPEAVGLGPAAVVRLERALAHEVLPLHDIDGARPPAGGRTQQGRAHGGSRLPVHGSPASIAEDTRGPAARAPTPQAPPAADRPGGAPPGTVPTRPAARRRAPPGSLPGCGRGC